MLASVRSIVRELAMKFISVAIVVLVLGLIFTIKQASEELASFESPFFEVASSEGFASPVVLLSYS